MDPIFDRLGRLIRSFGGDSRSERSASSDPLEREAEEELEEFLRTGRDAPKRPGSQGSRAFHEQRRQEAHRSDLPLGVLQAYAVLGLSQVATWEQINSAHRTLLKEHHPDRHAGNETLVKRATDQSQKINEAYQVLKKHLGR